MIHRIKKSNAVWVDTDDDISTEATEYFNNLFTGSLESSSDMLHLIPPMVSGEDNKRLEAVPTIKEVYEVVKLMDGKSAAGPDGFTGKFFTFAWEVIGQDVYNAVLSFFCGADLLRFITSTSIVLIPKKPNPQEFSHFRPISLCNFFNKLLSRILADRVAVLLPKIISPQQTGFVKGRNITENFLLAQEVVSSMGKKNRGGNVLMKLDMFKAYDWVSWGHIINVLRKFGFGEIFIDLVWRLLSNVWFSIIINGSSYGFFKSSRGFRQGDPLSPALFIIGAEVLSRGLNNLIMQSGFVGFKVPYGCPSITHLAFADDVLIFANGSSFSLKAIMQVLKAYQRCSRQLINVQKSYYLVHPSMPLARRRQIERITRFAWHSFPIRYLGFPLYFGRCKSSYYGGVCQSILGRILSWKSRLLSFGGKIVLIKHVLASMPMHLLSAAVLPGKLFKTIENACSAFLWGSSPADSKYHWIRWSHLCYLVDEGGVGFRRLWDVYKAFSCKLWWNFRTGSSLWAIFLKAKYCKSLHPCQVELKLTDSAIWRRMVNVSRQVELSMLWDRSCHFWYDNWLGSGALFLQAQVIPNLTFHNFVINGHWDLNSLGLTMPKEKMSSIMKHIPREEGSEVEVIWMHTTSGKFSLQSAFEDIRQARNKSMVFASIWHPRIPWKVSFFMLRLFLGRLPLPDRLCKLGFHLPSKCLCCSSASAESIEHLFANGQIASEVWNYFGGLCGFSCSGSSLPSSIVGWWLRLHDTETRQLIDRILPNIVCWQIWKARNKAMFEGVQMRSSGWRWRSSSGSNWFTTDCLFDFLEKLHLSVQKIGPSLSVFKHIRSEIRQIWKLLQEPVHFSHCYREANIVADALSNVGVSHPHQKVKVYDSFTMFPREARGAICLDKLGLPSIRKIRLEKAAAIIQGDLLITTLRRLMVNLSKIARFSPKLWYKKELYLVKSSSTDGEPFLVVTRDKIPNYEDEQGFELDKPIYGTTEFQVFELVSTTGGGKEITSRWKEVKNLGSRSIFLGHSSSMCLENNKLGPGIKSGHIYFTDDAWEAYLEIPEGGGKDMGVYNLEKGVTAPLYDAPLRLSRTCPSLWITPNF
ncbi:uncharacterized protein [Coffea arabica]|uniref:Reverse transcriptase domain-containing protein n=1 Tax=Coffea arabica TaxID=13443 RepID=A0ABM4VH86_COFAR